MEITEIKNLIKQAKKSSFFAYSPYSNFTVGAVLVANSGKTYTGCNIENAGIQAICAERVAFSKAISEGETNFKCIVVVAKPIDSKLYSETLPCGYCRQFMSEFCTPDFTVYSYDEANDQIQSYLLKDLLPYGFTL